MFSKKVLAIVGVCCAHFCFAFGTVLMKLALQQNSNNSSNKLNAVVFTFYREACAAVIMTYSAWKITGIMPNQSDIYRISALGVSLFFNQLLYIEGVDFVGVLVACCMQPAIPVFTAALAILIGQEKGDYRKVAGILIAVIGAVSMVIGNSETQEAEVNKDISPGSLGMLFLLGNTMTMSTYFLNVKELSKTYPAICLAAWAYVVASVLMATFGLLSAKQEDWFIPTLAYGPLLYWIIVGSVGCYFALTWATAQLTASQATSFQCVQPLFGTLLAILWMGEKPNVWDLGAVGIILGLMLVVTSAPQDIQKPQSKALNLGE